MDPIHNLDRHVWLSERQLDDLSTALQRELVERLARSGPVGLHEQTEIVPGEGKHPVNPSRFAPEPRLIRAQRSTGARERESR
jgi:hypothetical protein